MPLTYQAIATVTVGASTVSSIGFTNIPQTFTDLVIKVSARCTGGGAFGGLVIAFNGSSANYSLTYVGDANGSAASYTRSAFGSNHLFYIPSVDATANSFGNGEIVIPNYTSSTNKPVSADGVNTNNAATIYQGFSAGFWAGAAPVTSLALTTSGNFTQYTTATLYGIKNS